MRLIKSNHIVAHMSFPFYAFGSTVKSGHGTMPCCPGKEVNCPNFTEIYPWVRLILQYGSRQTVLRMTSREEQRISRRSRHLGGCQSGISKETACYTQVRTANLSPNHREPDCGHMTCCFSFQYEPYERGGRSRRCFFGFVWT